MCACSVNMYVEVESWCMANNDEKTFLMKSVPYSASMNVATSPCPVATSSVCLSTKNNLSLDRSHSRPNDANFLSNGCGCTSNDIENEVEEKTWSPSLRQNLSPLAKFAKETSFSLISALLAAGWCWPVSGVPHQSKQSHSFCYHYDDCEVQLMSYKCVPLSQEPVL